MSFVQLVTFELCGDEYAVEINLVNGIIQCKNYTVSKMPNSPRELEGIINLRGKVTPVFNLKKKFRYEEESINPESKLIIIYSDGTVVGFIVDEVTDIFRLSEEDIEPYPSSINNGGGYIKGIGKVEGKMVVILDLIKALNENDVQQLHSIKDMVES